MLVTFTKSALMLVAILIVTGCTSTTAVNRESDKELRLVTLKPNPITAQQLLRRSVDQNAFVPVGPNMPTGLEREALNRFIRETDVLAIILDEAMSQQRNDKRINFNYVEVKRDIDLVKQGVLDYLNARSSSPRNIEPIRGNYRH